MCHWKHCGGRKYNLRLKMSFDGRWPSMRDKLQWMMIFEGRLSSMEDILDWKMTSYISWPSMGENFIWWNIPFTAVVYFTLHNSYKNTSRVTKKCFMVGFLWFHYLAIITEEFILYLTLIENSKSNKIHSWPLVDLQVQISYGLSVIMK